MNHQDHVNLLRGAVDRRGGCWADFGSGEGAFTLALRDLVGPEGEIFSVEKDRARLDRQQRDFQTRFPDSRVHFVEADFTRPLELLPLDGFVMANALHFFRDKERLLRQLGGYLKPQGCLVLVEYNVDVGNSWVPYPMAFEAFERLAVRAGFTRPSLLTTVPSRFLHEIYSALAFKAGDS
jgi:ubiquinone/menaquinone biosynthesis C-methylase UbiE